MSAAKSSYINYWEEQGAQKNYSTPFQVDEFTKHVSPDAQVLDVGCGYGRIMSVLKEIGYNHVKGVEPSLTLIERARNIDEGLHISPLEKNRIPYDADSFDAVLLVAVLTCVPEDGEQDALLAEILRVLRPGGILYVNDFLLNTDMRNLERYTLFQEKHGTYGIFELEGGGVLRHFAEERIEQLFKPFSALKYEKVVYTTMNGNKSNGFYYIGRKYD